MNKAMISTNWPGYRIAAWGGQCLLTIAVLVTAAQGKWKEAIRCAIASLVFETLANVVIGFIDVLTFAQGRFDLVGLMAGLGIGGLAVAFAAQKTLEQLLGTVVLYLDRPFVPGEYIRLPRSRQLPEGLFGRVESIGLRSTKIRTAAKSTLFIVPNSTSLRSIHSPE